VSGERDIHVLGRRDILVGWESDIGLGDVFNGSSVDVEAGKTVSFDLNLNGILNGSTRVQLVPMVPTLGPCRKSLSLSLEVVDSASSKTQFVLSPGDPYIRAKPFLPPNPI
jgi:hypothetical protein